ncbi:kumamolisin [Kitasatospora sp. MAA4]|uniref:S53 family peptidase n=1 Tax=Kitasatospora sp. MAA4 TaxID=3035093 RepID=UPI0024764853|nr:S53 family peptidase [Kitasatospora sp. MAA4]MDH6134458.1 kumamolisin [Kitasatospora sp. MAA4]
MFRSHYVALPDSERVPLRGARALGPPDPNENLTVSVYLRRDPGAPAPIDVNALGLTPPTHRRPADDAQILADNQAAGADLAAVEKFAAQHGLRTVATNEAARCVQLSGTAAKLADAFQVTLSRYQYQTPDGRRRSYIGREHAVNVPEELSGIVTAVLGLDNRPLGANLLRRTPARTEPPPMAKAQPQIPAGTFLPNRLGDLYAFPQQTDGTGQCIAVLAFNGMTQPGTPSGGYKLGALTTYFENVLGQSTPSITDVVVHGPGNDCGRDDRQADPQDTTGEIMLDLQVIGALAPKANIVVYFTVFTEQGWVDAMNAIVTDTTNKPNVVSCSYGNPEDSPGSAWTAAGISQVDQAFATAAARNITICCASGDDGSQDQGTGIRAHADFPASSPHVLGVGGTTLVAAAAPGNTITSETVWDDGPGSATGGGVSRLFPVPPWQDNAHVPLSANPPHSAGRGVPDVSALADPQTGVNIISVDGQHLIPIGGTSAAAPQWSALIARVNQGLGAPVGYLNPLLYTKLSSDLRDITQGSNGAYAAGPGWDACSGFGSPNGQALLNDLKAMA